MVALQCANDMFSERLAKMEALWGSGEYTRKALEQVVKRLDGLEVSLLATSKKIDDKVGFMQTEFKEQLSKFATSAFIKNVNKMLHDRIAACVEQLPQISERIDNLESQLKLVQDSCKKVESSDARGEDAEEFSRTAELELLQELKSPRGSKKSRKKKQKKQQKLAVGAEEAELTEVGVGDEDTHVATPAGEENAVTPIDANMECNKECNKAPWSHTPRKY